MLPPYSNFLLWKLNFLSKIGLIVKSLQYSVATLLDPRYKWYFFRPNVALKNAKRIVQNVNIELFDNKLAPDFKIYSIEKKLGISNLNQMHIHLPKMIKEMFLKNDRRNVFKK